MRYHEDKKSYKWMNYNWSNSIKSNQMIEKWKKIINKQMGNV